MRKYHLGLIFILLLAFNSAAAMQFSHNEAEILPPPPLQAEPFSVAELETASPFDPDIIRRTFFAVAKEMNINIKPDISFPVVVVSTHIPVDKIHEYTGIELGTNMINYFGYLKNTILLIRGSKIHTLAHELTHYFQFHYHINGDITLLNYDPEPEAVRIQNLFRQDERVRTAAAE
jgi:hypothetical protein